MAAALAAYVDTRQVGRATATAISEGTARWAPLFTVPEAEWRAALPEADAQGRIVIGLHVFLVQLDGAIVLIDPGFDDPAAPGGYITPKLEEIARSPGLGAALAALGVAPAAVTHVVLTHAHPDHVCGIAVERDGELTPVYPRARHLIGAGDWPAPAGGPAATPPVAPRLALLERRGQVETVASEQEIAPGITLIPAAGETPGHLIVCVESDGQRCYLLGDLFHHGCEVSALDWAPPGRDVAATVASRRRLLAEAVPAGATLAFTHELFPPWGRLVATGDGYRWARG
jgi:glyoxylase-like metal-dependent hydrolase (beta-lactamase superfamily II)